MPVRKSAQKQVRVAERKRLRNKPIRTLCKTSITRAEQLIFLGELEAAREAVVVAISSLDNAAEKGVIHPNNAARRKSRLMRKLNQAQASAPAEVKPKAAKAKPKAAKAKPKAKGKRDGSAVPPRPSKVAERDGSAVPPRPSKVSEG